MITDTIYDGIVWTAIRDMMTCTARPYIDEYIESVKRIAHLMNTKEREHQAWDIRQNIEWNKDFPWDNDTHIIDQWTSLATWLDSG